MVSAGRCWTAACSALVGCGSRRPSLAVGACCRQVSLRRMRTCSWRWSMSLWGCRQPGREDGDGVGRAVLDGGVLGLGGVRFSWAAAARRCVLALDVDEADGDVVVEVVDGPLRLPPAGSEGRGWCRTGGAGRRRARRDLPTVKGQESLRVRVGRAGDGSAGPEGSSAKGPLARSFYPATCYRVALRSPPRPPWRGCRAPLAPSCR